jgi:hypothetical protein
MNQKELISFWERVDKRKSKTFYNGERCWEWTASLTKKGYGQFGHNLKRSHRVSWVIAYGEIQDNLQVLHHCDNPPCVNPHHLFLGTNQDNRKDMMSKGRGGCSMKLNYTQVCEIRRRYAWWGIGGDSAPTLAKEFGVSTNSVIAIIKNKNWKQPR